MEKPLSFAEHLVLSELMMDIDPEADQSEIRQKIMQARRNPIRAANAEREAANQRVQDIAASDSPSKAQDMRTAQTQQKAATLQARDVRRNKGRAGQMQSPGAAGTAGTAMEQAREDAAHSILQMLAQQISEDRCKCEDCGCDPCECVECEIVYENIKTGELYSGDELVSEGFTRQMKRYGMNFVKKYRCKGGPKDGRLVASAAECGKRKDPAKVRRGRAVMRAKSKTIVRKTKQAKRQAASKILTRMNRRLAGNV